MPDLIEWSQVWIANWVTGMVAWLPIGCGAGMISCGFAMLPAESWTWGFLLSYRSRNELAL